MMPNHLAGSTSPYLLQHADNPVDWEPWGPQALERARQEQKPIFLSVGYSACHWCHVMAHESFEDAQLAALLNEAFVNIKVDREERPDIDAVYMQAVQMLTGRGGWPMSVFLTPDLEPFFAGTYWPPEPRHGMPGFGQVVAAVAEAWRARRGDVHRQAGEITAALRKPLELAPAEEFGEELLVAAADSLAASFDPVSGGFGAAPKFPHPMDLRLLLRSHARFGREQDLQMVCKTLEKMAAGGIHDQLGGGFARYSVDARWLVPHFEKMLYDNALLATCYLEASLASGSREFEAVARSTLDYLLREMRDSGGGFFSAEDADSEGEEGRYYVWTPTEIGDLLGDDAELFCRAYGVSEGGNFEGRSILHLPEPLAAVAAAVGIEPSVFATMMADCREKLLAARGRRERPGIDDKLIVAWNGLAIDALARAGAALGEARYTTAACDAAAFLLEQCREASGRLAHQWRRGTAAGLAFAEDLASLADGLVSLYEATFDERWIDEACRLADRLVDPDEGFLDPRSGGFFQTGSHHEPLLVRRPDLIDSATPGATGLAATALIKLAVLTGRRQYREAADGAIAATMPIAARAASAVSQSLLAADWSIGPTEELVVVGDTAGEPGRGLLAAIRGRFRPRSLTVARPAATAGGGPLDPLFAGRTAGDEGLRLFRCSGGRCELPLDPAAALAAVNEGH